MSTSKILALIAVVLFILAAFGVHFPVGIVELGLGFFAASFVV